MELITNSLLTQEPDKSHGSGNSGGYLSTRPNQSLLLVTVFAQSFLTLVRGHLMALTLFSAWHDSKFYSFVLDYTPDSNRLIKSITRSAITVSDAKGKYSW